MACGEEMSSILVQVKSYLICRGKEKKKSRTEQNRKKIKRRRKRRRESVIVINEVTNRVTHPESKQL